MSFLRGVSSGHNYAPSLSPGPGRAVRPDQPGAADNARLAGSRLVPGSEGEAGLGGCTNATPGVDGQCAGLDHGSGPSQTVNTISTTGQPRTTHIINNLIQGRTVLEILYHEMTKGADTDFSTRWPQPKCYPGTRVKLTTEIQDWFLHDMRKWDFLWLSGPSGVGKSTVARTVAEFAVENGILGATYFFSRPNRRFNYAEVFITLAYQLAVHLPGYRPLVTAKLAAEPDLLEKASCIQFRKLIVEPLLLLSHVRKHVIILDGLDECDGKEAQLEIVELINNLLHSSTSLPIIWMICSRPESHLTRIFARPDYAIQCWRNFISTDSEESRSGTETFVRGRFKEIHGRYGECVKDSASACWPPGAAIEQVVEKTSGLFIFASTLLKHIEDSEVQDLDERLGEVLAFFKHLHLAGSQDPMNILDLFYTHIFSIIPDDHLSFARQILVASTFRGWNDKPLAVQPMCTLLGITHAKFYVMMHRLHSVIGLPEPSDAAEAPLHFFHASFLDYLTDPNRSRQFSIGRLVTDYGVTVAAGIRNLVLSGLRCLGSSVGLSQVQEHEEEVQSNQEVSQSLRAALSWPSGDAYGDWVCAKAAIGDFCTYLFELLCMLLKHSELDDELLGVLRSFDFNALPFFYNPYWLCSPGPKNLHKLQPSSLVRIQSISDWDRALLSGVTKRYPSAQPFDLDDNDCKDGLFFLGDGTNSIAVVVEPEGKGSRLWFISLKTLPQVWPVLQHTSIA